MCAAAADDGVEVVVVTPHLRHPLWPDTDRAAILAGLEAVRAEVGERPLLLAGAEVHVTGDLLDEVDRLPDGELLTLAGSRYLLLELPFSGRGPDPREVVHEVAVAGWVPVLAHPERIEPFVDEPEALDDLVGLGAVLAITAPSVLGAYGPGPLRCCRYLLDRGLAHLLSSDAHGLGARPPRLSEARDAVARRWGGDVARLLTEVNPRAVVEDRPLGGPPAKADG